MDKNSLEIRGRELEELFFAKQNEKQIQKLREKMAAEHEREKLEQVTGIHDQKVLDHLQSLGMRSEILNAISLIPLITIAWADFELDKKERKAILAAAAEAGLTEASAGFELLADWLDHQPPQEMVQAWHDYVQALCQTLDDAGKAAFKDKVMGMARRIADTSGGYFGIIDRVSEMEEKALADLEKAFD